MKVLDPLVPRGAGGVGAGRLHQHCEGVGLRAGYRGHGAEWRLRGRRCVMALALLFGASPLLLFFQAGRRRRRATRRRTTLGLPTCWGLGFVGIAGVIVLAGLVMWGGGWGQGTGLNIVPNGSVTGCGTGGTIVAASGGGAVSIRVNEEKEGGRNKEHTVTGKTEKHPGNTREHGRRSLMLRLPLQRPAVRGWGGRARGGRGDREWGGNEVGAGLRE